MAGCSISAIGSVIRGQHDYANVSIWNPSAFARFSLGEKISFIPVLVRVDPAKAGESAAWFRTRARGSISARPRNISRLIGQSLKTGLAPGLPSA